MRGLRRSFSRFGAEALRCLAQVLCGVWRRCFAGFGADALRGRVVGCQRFAGRCGRTEGFAGSNEKAGGLIQFECLRLKVFLLIYLHFLYLRFFIFALRLSMASGRLQACFLCKADDPCKHPRTRLPARRSPYTRSCTLSYAFRQLRSL